MSVVLVDKYVKNFVGEHEYANIQGAISAAHEAFVNKSGAGKFFLGALLGAAAGAIAGKFMSDKIEKCECDEDECGCGCEGECECNKEEKPVEKPTEKKTEKKSTNKK